MQWTLAKARNLMRVAILLGGAHLSPETAWSSPLPPPIVREFRGLWIATVANIDWPSRPGLSSQQQQQELIALLDRAVSQRLNAVIFQVRPACDALYASPYEPWSEYLSGTMGQAPAPFYDPLEFAIREAHRRGLELHAWFNPFRVRHPNAKSPAAPSHLSVSHPGLVRKYAGNLWMVPTDEKVRNYSLAIIVDVLKRYDVDGIHLDDYFYPYPERTRDGRVMDFPDDPEWKAYLAAGGNLNRGDWRRKGVNQFVYDLYRHVKAIKPGVRVGISPFGIWRPNHPGGISGLDAYDSLYADARFWLQRGWMDYCSPQLYWTVESRGQGFDSLLRWWATQNTQQRHLWPGLNTHQTRVGKWPDGEILQQIQLSRRVNGVSGHIHWNGSSLPETSSLPKRLLAGPYQEPAVPPAFSWLDNTPPPAPVVSWESGQQGCRWLPGEGESAWLWVLQFQTRQGWQTRILPGHVRRYPAAGRDAGPWLQVYVQAVDRHGNLGLPHSPG